MHIMYIFYLSLLYLLLNTKTSYNLVVIGGLVNTYII